MQIDAGLFWAVEASCAASPPADRAPVIDGHTVEYFWSDPGGEFGIVLPCCHLILCCCLQEKLPTLLCIITCQPVQLDGSCLHTYPRHHPTDGTAQCHAPGRHRGCATVRQRLRLPRRAQCPAGAPRTRSTTAHALSAPGRCVGVVLCDTLQYAAALLLLWYPPPPNQFRPR